jgi:hypothetical protein
MELHKTWNIALVQLGPINFFQLDQRNADEMGFGPISPMSPIKIERKYY